MKRCTTEEPEDNDNLPARLPDNLTLRKTFFRKCEISSLEFLVTICILISCQISTISPKPEPNFPTQTHLWPGARAPVSGAGDVCVAGGHWLRFGHVFALAWLQGFLLISTHCLDAEHRPFSLSRSPTARRAFLPLSEPPAAQRDAKVHDWIVHLCWKITILYSCGNAEDSHRHTFRCHCHFAETQATLWCNTMCARTALMWRCYVFEITSICSIQRNIKRSAAWMKLFWWRQLILSFIRSVLVLQSASLKLLTQCSR